MNKIIFIGDLLRYQNKQAGFADRGIGWEYYLLKEQIYLATGIMPEVCYTNDTERFDLKVFYELSGYDITLGNWIKIASGEYSKESAEYVRNAFKDYLVITQVGGALKSIFDKLEIPYIDIYVSAIKFAQDLYFGLRTNIGSIRKYLPKYSINENELYIYANLIKSYYWSRNGQINLEPNSLLICGQNDIDLSLVKDNHIVSFLDYKNEIIELCKKYNKTYYKPHPYAKLNNPNEIFIRDLKNIEIIDCNFYQLMLNDNIKAIAALSSGTLTEAKYFGKKTHYLSHQFVEYCFNNEPNLNEFILMNNEIYSPTFWADILSPVIETRKCEYFSYRNTNNLLRNTLNTWWGYEIENSQLSNLNIINRLEKLEKLYKKTFSYKIRKFLNKPLF